MLRVIRNHRRAAYNAPAERIREPDRRCRWGSMPIWPRPSWSRPPGMPGTVPWLVASSTAIATPRPPCWRRPAPSVLLMDCDTTGVEPDFALVKFKKLAGGGYFKIANQSIEPALRNLGYTRSTSARRSSTTCLAPFRSMAHRTSTARRLTAKGFTDADIDKVECGAARRLRAGLCLQPLVTRRGGTRWHARHFDGRGSQARFRPAAPHRLHTQQIEEANEIICGTMTVEGAPYLKDEDLPSSTPPTSAARRAPASSITWVTSR